MHCYPCPQLVAHTFFEVITTQHRDKNYEEVNLLLEAITNF